MAMTMSSPGSTKHRSGKSDSKAVGKPTKEANKQVRKESQQNQFGPFTISPEELAKARATTGWKSWFEVVKFTILAFMKDRCTQLAAAMTYYTTFSLFPLILLAIAILSFFIQSQNAQATIVQQVNQFMPSASSLVEQAIKAVINARGVATGFGIVTLLWGALGFFGALDNSINYVWGVTVSRSFIKGKLFALAMLAAMFIVMGGSWALTGVVSYLQSPNTPFSPALSIIPLFVWQALSFILPLFFDFVLLLLLYKFVPMRNLTFKQVWPAAVIMAILWEITRQAVAFYMTRFANYENAYGSIGAVMALIFWLYVVGVVLLLGTELSKSYAMIKQGLNIQPVEPDAVPPVDVHQTSVEAASGVQNSQRGSAGNSHKSKQSQDARTSSHDHEEIENQPKEFKITRSMILGAILGVILAFRRKKEEPQS